MILKPSRLLAAALVAAHTAAAATLIPLALPVWAKASIIMLIATSLAHGLWRHAWLRGDASVIAIELMEDDRAAFETGDGVRHEAGVLGTTYVTSKLCVVNLRVAGCLFARHAIVVADNLDAESFRQLRVRLRWGYRRDGTTITL